MLNQPQKTRYFHGGIDGLLPGQYLLPPDETKTPSISAYMGKLCRTDHVYVTTDVHAAMMYAAASTVGSTVYEVQPIGELEHDEDCNEKGLSYSCPKARILFAKKMTPQLKANLLARLLTTL